MPRIFIAALFAAARRAYRLRPENPSRVALEHIILNVGLCKAVARLSPQTNVSMRVVVSDRAKRAEFDQTVRFQRGTGNSTPVEFDSSWGTYRVALSVPAYGCNAVDFLEVLPDHNRSMNVTLVDGSANSVAPVIILGALPQSFSYAQPSVVIFPATLRCNGMVGDPQMNGIDNELEQDAYYSSIRTPALYRQPIAVTLAVRLQDSSGGFHYIRMPWSFSSGFTWPSIGKLDIDDSVLGWVAQQTEDILLCPKFYGTSAEQ
jgi:hypothetical protein